MFSLSPPSTSSSSRRIATLCSAAAHMAAVAALWVASQAITAPPIPHHERREAVLIVSPPPRLFRPSTKPKATVQRFEMKRAAPRRTPEAIRPEPQAPNVEARTAPILPKEPVIAVTNPAARPVGFPEAARTTATVPRLELEPRASAFGSALGRTAAASVAAPAHATGFGAVGLTKTQSPTAAGDSGFGGVGIRRTARRAGTASEAGFGATERGVAAVAESEPAAQSARNRPAKILWKPVPKYSEEGIRRRIEGEVVLLVRFLAQGTVETLEVVSGLGYGLDEYALQAAESIRFEPAIEGDRAVDYTARVRIRFELAY